jgi:membrane-associated phospholipid phosphatase
VKIRPLPALLAPAAALALATAGPAAAQPAAPAGGDALRTSWPAEVAVVVGSLAVVGLARFIAVDPGARWQREMLPLDEPVKRNFSQRAALASDITRDLTLLVPVAAHLDRGFNRALAVRALVYGEALLANTAVNAVVKALVGRPRPYAYSDDPRARAEVDRDPRDARLAFYSGHAATTFAAAVAGAYLYSQSRDAIPARTAVWGGTLFLAGATANLRVRAGRHFYSDVLAGALVGSGVGLLVPALHYGGREPHAVHSSEWVAIGVAPLAGALASQLVPFGENTALAHAQLLPWAVPTSSGAAVGLALAGLF